MNCSGTHPTLIFHIPMLGQSHIWARQWLPRRARRRRRESQVRSPWRALISAGADTRSFRCSKSLQMMTSSQPNLSLLSFRNHCRPYLPPLNPTLPAPPPPYHHPAIHPHITSLWLSITLYASSQPVCVIQKSFINRCHPPFQLLNCTRIQCVWKCSKTFTIYYFCKVM